MLIRVKAAEVFQNGTKEGDLWHAVRQIYVRAYGNVLCKERNAPTVWRRNIAGGGKARLGASWMVFVEILVYTETIYDSI